MHHNCVCLKWRGTGFGNALIMAHLTRILNDNGINAVYGGHFKTDGLVDVPLWTKENKNCFVYYKGFPSTYYVKVYDEPVITMYLRDLSTIINVKLAFNRDIHNHVPIIYEDMPNIPYIDVVMNTKTGPWAPCRDWPHFSELKKLLDMENISYIDLNLENKMSIECLNYVNKSKLYLGLETGMSHYVSKYANGKTIILQGGFAPFYYWAYPYNYDYITATVTCKYRPCGMDRKMMLNGVNCLSNYACMSEITPEVVLEAILRRIR